MPWGTVELESEVWEWLEGLPTEQFATAAFYIDLLAERGPLLVSRTRGSSTGSSGSCDSTLIGGRCG
jgi:hypothetical protein